MARVNKVHLRGQVFQDPVIRKDADGNYLYAFVYLRTMRSSRKVGDGEKKKTDIIPITTKTPGLIREIEAWEENNIVDVKGTFTTKANINKPSFCEVCQTNGLEGKNIVKGVTGYVTPIHCELIKKIDNKKEAFSYLEEHREISNEIYFMGNLTKEPKMYKTKNGNITYTQYQLAADRSYKVNTDIPENKTDYPHVKAYGEKAREHKQFLQRGSLIYIDGMLQARELLRTTKCPVCGEFYKWKDATMEIIPFTTEFIANIKSQEEVASEENKSLQAALSTLYGSEATNEVEYDDIVEEEDMNETVD